MLVVDDEPDMLEAMTEALFDLCPRVYRAGSAAEALAVLRDHDQIAVVVTDIRMPDTDGLALLERMMAERGSGAAALTVVMVTGHAALDAARTAMRSGAVEFLTKPFGRAELHDAVRHAMNLARARRAEALRSASQAQALALALAASAEASPIHDIAPPMPGRITAEADQRAVLAHGLRTPLVPLVGLAELLQNPELPRGQIQAYARLIAQGADRLKHHVTRLLDFDGLAQGVVRMRQQPIAAARMAAEALRRLAPRAVAGQVTLRQDVPETLTLRADPDWLPWSLAELLDNALRVSPPRTTVTLAAGAAEGGAWIAVTDQGPGLPEALLIGRPQPFASAEAVSNRTSTTLGLGLAIVDRVAALHGGTLTLRRLPEGGSEARLVLPG